MVPLTRAAAKPSASPSSSRHHRPLLLNRKSQPHPYSSSSDEDDDEAAATEEEANAVDDDYEDENRQHQPPVVQDHTQGRNDKGKAPITLKKICKVCKGTGHQAGFRGATYIDCPKKPCFLCKLPGHTTMSCPHRVAMEHGVIPHRRNTRTPLDYVFNRQLRPNTPTIKPAFVIPNQVDCGIIRFHSRRVTCLEFHPTRTGVLLSGDKKGQLGIWNYAKLHENTVYDSVHSCILNNMKFSPANDGTLYTSSSDGTASCTDLETGIPFRLMDLNPDGWNGPASWRMLYGLDVNPEKGLLLAADNFGYLYFLNGNTGKSLDKVQDKKKKVDSRSRRVVDKPILIHKKGSKVVGLHCNPFQPDLLLSCGNDHFARLWDIRRLEDGSSLGNLAHGRVVNSAFFSPLTGSKILSTSQDNRIRVWDSIFGDLECPSREIVHSHDFNRHLTPFRAEWDPKDPSESLAVIGRYISENYNGVALHPIDFIDTNTGQLVAEVTEAEITTISPVNKLHPKEDILASGSSRSLYIWKPKKDSETELQKEQDRTKHFITGMNEKKKSSRNLDFVSDDDGFSLKGKKSKPKVRLGK